MIPRRPAPAVTHHPVILPQPQPVAQQMQQPPQPSQQAQFPQTAAQQKNLDELKSTLAALKASLAARSEKHAAFHDALSRTENALGEHPAEERIQAILSQGIAQKIVAEKKKAQ